ncbi:alkyl sulfatase dimerization domain-containing protein [Actinomadura namibiensis]|uniref:Alkyl sulfatase BDS1-like metallo-beta-lactamase superfamily hydrolase n=1 Tax=Actinomadura namibiensis TaxID=182080 RepID=A0A7W3QM79_ACTNM|nr:alkyl sulfatase dimerization domain-containing protein [Actinomadura namibiensis]MBA8952274.1 alkyl sulfatase BDS1-like metallo-beta-lactamase superfamily hydrolase [Actinomadura namibiensis]
MTIDIRDHADRVWRGELDDSITHTGMNGAGVVDVADGLGWQPGFGNAVAFRTDDGLVLFDTGNQYTAGQLHRNVREWCDAPLTTAFYSHGHIDHVMGMAPFDAEPGPRPQVVAHENVPARFDRYLLTHGYNTVINRRQFQAPELTWPTDYRYPDVTFRDGLTVTRGGLTFELFHAKGETDDAAVAWVPEHRLLLPGDLFIWLAPNCGNPQKAQRYPREWAHALRRMAALGAETMIPSHGLPVFGAERVHQALTETAEWLEGIVEQTLAMLNDGRRLDDVVHAVRPPARLADRVYLRARYDEPEFIVRNLWRLYGGWYDGDPAHLKPAPAADLARALADLAGGAARLADAARRAAGSGDLRVAAHLAELAVQADPQSTGLHEARAEVYAARAAAESSLMARGVYTWAADESRRAAGDETAARPTVPRLIG